MKALEILATQENLPRALAFVFEALEGLPADPTKLQQLEVAVDEVFTNIASYAYAPGTGSVRITLKADPATSRVWVRFSDSGEPYDPLAKPDPNVKLSLRERKRGGLGIFIVKKQMDSVEYAFVEGRNELTLHKKLV